MLTIRHQLVYIVFVRKNGTYNNLSKLQHRPLPTILKICLSSNPSHIDNMFNIQEKYFLHIETQFKDVGANMEKRFNDTNQATGLATRAARAGLNVSLYRR